MINDWEDMLVVENIDLNHLIRVLYERFDEYDINEYENNWMDKSKVG